jgi:hypothetical protein
MVLSVFNELGTGNFTTLSRLTGINLLFALVVPEDFPKTDKPVIRVKLPKNAMARLLVEFEEKLNFSLKSPSW